MINKKVALVVINKALSTGGDYAELYIEDTINNSIVLENGDVSISSSTSLCGVGLRILKENRCVYGFTNDISQKGLLALATNLSKSFNGLQNKVVTEFINTKYKNRNRIKDSLFVHSKNEKISILKEGIEAILSLNNPKVVRTQAGFSSKLQNIEVFNSKSMHFTRINEYGRVSYLTVCADENGMEIGFCPKGTQAGFYEFQNKEENTKLALHSVQTALTMLEAKPCPNGTMPVVVACGEGGVLFHEACGHPLESSSVAKGLSPFANKIGELIASPLVSAVDDSTIPGAWGSIDIDDEGNVGQKRQLIRNGVLENYMVEDFTGRRMNAVGNGSCRRQNYKYCPTSRMSNTYICNGKSTKDEIIKSTKLGLYAVSFKGGQVDPSTGEFCFGCNEAYIIRNGKICEPVKGATLVGKGDEVLKKIDMVGNDLAFSDGICGSTSGSINVCIGQPTIRISAIAVGGTGGEIK